MQQIPFSRARANLAETLRAVAAGDEPAVISRHGSPTAVLMSVAQFRRLSGSEQGFADKLDEWRDQHLSEAAANDATDATDPGDPWADVRDITTGRDAPW